MAVTLDSYCSARACIKAQIPLLWWYAMKENKRDVTLYTPSKIYSGQVDIKAENIRTLDLLNSANIYWRDPAEKSFGDALLLNGADIKLLCGTPLGGFGRLQMRLSEIIFFTDNLQSTGDIAEKRRDISLATKVREKTVSVRILTRMAGDTFYLITGSFAGLFKKKSQSRYLPITNAKVKAIVKKGEEWKSRTIVNNQFIGLSTAHIEACSFV